MLPLKAFVAVFHGARLCLFESKVRRLALKPWFFAALLYPFSLLGGWYLWSHVVQHFTPHGAGFFSLLLFYVISAFAGLILFMLSVFAALLLVLILTSIWQTPLAEAVLLSLGQSLPERPNGIKEVGRTIYTEGLKYVWLVPALIFSFLIGLIPIFAPFALLFASWLLAYQFVDIFLDLYAWPPLSRMGFSLRHFLLLVFFGLGISAICLIPFAAILVPTAGVAGAGWLLTDSRLLPEISRSKAR